MTADSSSWDDFFQQSLVPVAVAHVIETWNAMPKPGPADFEDAISVKLYSSLVRSKDRQRHMFLIDYQSVEVDLDLEREIGRKDVIFRPTLQDERVYLCFEAKRLNALVSGEQRSLADEYVKEGMQRFVDRKYAPFVQHGGMLAYVLDGNLDRAITNVDNNIRNRTADLRMDDNGRLLASAIRPDDSFVKETHHRRPGESTPFRIHHLFMACTRSENENAP